MSRFLVWLLFWVAYATGMAAPWFAPMFNAAGALLANCGASVLAIVLVSELTREKEERR